MLITLSYTTIALATQKFSKLNDLELVILVGSPGAGKTTFAKRYITPLGYERVNQDILKTRERCLKASAEYLGAKKSVVVGTLCCEAPLQ